MPDPGPATQDPPLRRFGLPLLVFIIAFAAFVPALEAAFVDIDDVQLLIENTRWRGLGPDHLRWMFTTTLLGHYQPLTWVSYGINYVIGGMDPFGYHLVNVLVHALNAVLVYLVAHRLFRAGAARSNLSPAMVALGAVFGAVFWAAHPLRAESVAWVTERRDVLSAFFLLGALLAYLRMVEARGAGGRGWGAYALSITLLLLSLLCKTWGMTLFAVLLVLDCYPLGRLPVRPWKWLQRRYIPVLAEKVPYLLLGLAFAAIIGIAFRSTGTAMKSLDSWPLGFRIAQATYGLVFYLWKSVAPSGLAPLYLLPRPFDPMSARFLVGYAALALGVLGVVILARRFPALACAAIIYAIIVSPVLGLFQSGGQLVADRYSYVSCIGLSIAFGSAVVLIARRVGARDRLLLGAAAIILAVYGTLAFRQAAVWRTPLSLWEHAVKVGTPNSTVHIEYGHHLGLADRNEESLEQFRIASRMSPDNIKATLGLAAALRRLKRFDEAGAVYIDAGARMPQDLRAILLIERGNMFVSDLQRTSEGLALLREAVRQAERSGKGIGIAKLSLGSALLATGSSDAAAEEFRGAAQHPASRDEAVRLLREMGRTP